MEDLLWDAFFLIVVIILIVTAIFLIFAIVIGIIDICKTDKPKKKYYLIKYEYMCKHEIIIKAPSSLKARLKFQRKYPRCDFISIEEMKDE